MGIKPPVNPQPTTVQVASKPKPDKIAQLVTLWKSVQTRPPDHLEKLLESPSFGHILAQNMKTLFPVRSTTSAQEILKNQKIAPELSSRPFEELFNSISCSLNICIGTVYEALESKLLAMVNKQALNWLLNPSSQAVLERLVSKKWHEDRLKFLSLRAQIVDRLNGSGPRAAVIRKWLEKMCREKALFKGLVDDLEALIGLKAANFNEKDYFIRNLAKIKEQNFLTTSLFQLISVAQVDRAVEKQLIDLMIRTNFTGVFAEKLSEGIAPGLTGNFESTQINTKIMFELLVLELLLQGVNLRDPRKTRMDPVVDRMLALDKSLIDSAKAKSKVDMLGE